VDSLSTGELFRKHLKEKTVLGSKVEEFVEKGDLVPDDVTFSLVKDFLDKAGADSRIIFDGFLEMRIRQKCWMIGLKIQGLNYWLL